VLLAAPHDVFAEQPLLRRAVVLVLEHSEEAGTIGILLHSRSNATLGRLLDRTHDPVLRPLASNPLWIGGNVVTRTRLRVLTLRCDVPSGRLLLPGLYMCDAHAAARMCAVGAARPSEFHVYAASCQWTAGKLADELAQAIWLHVWLWSRVAMAMCGDRYGHVSLWCEHTRPGDNK